MKPIIHGSGAQTLRHIPHDHNGRPRVVASATVEIADLRYSEDSDEREVLASTAATIGAVSTTLSAAAGPGESDTYLLPLASVTIPAAVVVGRPYLVTGADGEAELVTVRAISSLNVYTHLELRRDYALGATFRSVEITASFPALEADDDTEIEAEPHGYQATWTYTIDGEVYVVPVIHWLSRTTLAPIVDELYVLRGFPTIGPRLRNRADVGDAIAIATEEYNAEVRVAGRDPASFRGNDTSRIAVRARALQHCFEWMGPAEHDVRQALRFESQFKYLMSQLLDGRPRPATVTVDQPSNTGAQDTKATHTLFTRR
jgi:hypothetical protein